MELGIIGLGRMGGAMSARLLNGGHKLVVFDPIEQARQALVAKGAVGAGSVAELVQKLALPRAVWVMVPSGKPTEDTIGELGSLLSSGDLVIDGGNSYYKDSMRRTAALKARGIGFLDVGTSGGIWGLEEGYCLMVGGSKSDYRRMEPVLRTLAPSPNHGWGHMGPSGAGHYVKMVHNGIEYGRMEAFAGGVELLQAKQDFKLDLHKVANIWRYGSVVRSWLLDLAAESLRVDPRLDRVQAYVEDSGEGRWTVQEAIELAIPVPVISQSLQMRFRSRQDQPFGARLLAALRHQFGGHPVRKAG